MWGRWGSVRRRSSLSWGALKCREVTLPHSRLWCDAAQLYAQTRSSQFIRDGIHGSLEGARTCGSVLLDEPFKNRLPIVCFFVLLLFFSRRQAVQVHNKTKQCHFMSTYFLFLLYIMKQSVFKIIKTEQNTSLTHLGYLLFPVLNLDNTVAPMTDRFLSAHPKGSEWDKDGWKLGRGWEPNKKSNSDPFIPP